MNFIAFKYLILLLDIFYLLYLLKQLKKNKNRSSVGGKNVFSRDSLKDHSLGHAVVKV